MLHKIKVFDLKFAFVGQLCEMVVIFENIGTGSRIFYSSQAGQTGLVGFALDLVDQTL
jgi:hypothetical protein